MTDRIDIADVKRVSIACMDCSSANTTSRVEADEFDYLSGNEIVRLQADVYVHTCQDCGFEFTDSSAEDARHNTVCKFLGVLNPSEVKSVRAKYGLTRSQMAARTKIGEASLARWESGALLQSGAYDNYLFLLTYDENMERIQMRSDSEHFAPEANAHRTWPALVLTDKLRADKEEFSLNRAAA